MLGSLRDFTALDATGTNLDAFGAARGQLDANGL
jgi:hypothetical protein